MSSPAFNTSKSTLTIFNRVLLLAKNLQSSYFIHLIIILPFLTVTQFQTLVVYIARHSIPLYSWLRRREISGFFLCTWLIWKKYIQIKSHKNTAEMSTTIMYGTLIYAPSICALISPHIFEYMINALCSEEVQSPVHKSNWQCPYSPSFIWQWEMGGIRQKWIIFLTRHLIY